MCGDGRFHRSMQWLVMPQWRSQRIRMAFPIHGADASAIVLLEAKKRWGRHSFKLLAVDIPSRAPLGQETRVIIRGDDAALGSRGVAVLEELRQPLRAAMAAEEGGEYDAEDAEDDGAWEARARAAAAAQAKARRGAEKDALAEGRGMYVHERLYWCAHEVVKAARVWLRRLASGAVEERPPAGKL
jgi:hypothetical protein